MFAAAGKHRETCRVDAKVRPLVLDDEGIFRVRGVKRVLNRPRRRPKNPLPTPDTSWEQGDDIQ